MPVCRFAKYLLSNHKIIRKNDNYSQNYSYLCTRQTWNKTMNIEFENAALEELFT